MRIRINYRRADRDQMAEEMERIAKEVRKGFTSGAVTGGNGWWDLIEG